jgi:hypothetical protein
LYFPLAVFESNVLAGQPAYSTRYPAGNFFPATLADVVFSNSNAVDVALSGVDLGVV